MCVFGEVMSVVKSVKMFYLLFNGILVYCVMCVCVLCCE